MPASSLQVLAALLLLTTTANAIMDTRLTIVNSQCE